MIIDHFENQPSIENKIAKKMELEKLSELFIFGMDLLLP